jgi:predicted NBD/HSP70 family sugar kinase
MMRELDELAMAGIAGAVELEDDIIEKLAGAMATIVNLFTPELVLLGGTLSSMPERMLERLDSATRDRIFPLLRESLRIETADGRDESLIRGAAAIALEELHYA